jgi:hypothetical protein
VRLAITRAVLRRLLTNYQGRDGDRIRALWRTSL